MSWLVVLTDQATKSWARAKLPYLNDDTAPDVLFALTFNDAGVLSVGLGLPEPLRKAAFLALPALVLLAGMAWLTTRGAQTLPERVRIAFGVIGIAGMSNWLDRLWLPGVTDFIRVGPACANVADFFAVAAGLTVWVWAMRVLITRRLFASAQPNQLSA